VNIKDLQRLHPKAFEKAYEEWREHEPYDGWDEIICEMAVEDGAERGFMIDSTTRQTPSGMDRTDPSIYWSGFWSQGDGASWVGHVDIPKWIEWMRAQRAEELDRGPCRPGNGTPFTDAQLLYIDAGYENDLLEARMHISASADYSHSGTMNCNETSQWVYYGAEETLSFGVFAGMHCDTFVDTFTQIVGEDGLHEPALAAAREFADQIYRNLEEEYEYLTSEEAFIEVSQDEDFDPEE
jgi:hypothetical protein